MQPSIKRRVLLFKQDPHCYWCGVETHEQNGMAMDNTTATLDHLWAVGTLERKTDSSSVLACNRCNLERGAMHSTRLNLRKRIDALKLAPNPDEVRKKRIAAGETVQNFVFEDKGNQLPKTVVLPQTEMAEAIKVASDLNKAGVTISNKVLPSVTLTKPKLMKKQYLYLATFGIGCWAIGANLLVIAGIAFVFSCQYFIKD